MIFRTYMGKDAYVATVKSLGPGIKKGKIVFYNRNNSEVYLEKAFDGLAPGQTFTTRIMKTADMLSSTAENLAVRVLSEGESLDEAQPTNKYRQVGLLPAWFGDYINQVGSANANRFDEDDEATDDGGGDENGGAGVDAPDTGVLGGGVGGAASVAGVVGVIVVVGGAFCCLYRKSRLRCRILRFRR